MNKDAFMSATGPIRSVQRSLSGSVDGVTKHKNPTEWCNPIHSDLKVYDVRLLQSF